MTIFFDMDGTIANLYGENNWLADLIAEYTRPYRNAKPLVDMRKLARVLNKLQREGYEIGIISWLSKSGSDGYNERVTKAKLDWLARHLGSVQFDEIHIVKYGTYKEQFKHNENDILFDDEINNRNYWGANAYDVNNILEILGSL